VSVGRIQRWWWNFWWGPAHPGVPAALRIGLATVAIWAHLSWWPEVDTLLDVEGQARNVVDWSVGRGYSVYSISGVTGDLAHVVHALGLVPLVALLVGFGGRWTSVLAWLVVLGWYQRVPGASTGGDRLLRFGLLYLSTGHTTAAWSVDAWRRKTPSPSSVSRLPVRLIQVQWAAMYALSGLDKARGSTWRDGTALHYALSSRTFDRLDGLLHPILESTAWAPILQAATVAVLVWELAFPALVVFGRTRWIALLVGIFVHVGIGVTMSVGPFTLVTLVGYLAFFDRWFPAETHGSVKGRSATHTHMQSSRPLDEHGAPNQSPPQELP